MVAYARRVRAYISACVDDMRHDAVQVLPVLLAVPPPSDLGGNPKAPFVGHLSDRVRATDVLNRALEAACLSAAGDDNARAAADEENKPEQVMPVAFTGIDTWSFAQSDGTDGTAAGALRHAMSDGHVHVQESLCGPLHVRVRRVIAHHLGIACDAVESAHAPQALSVAPSL